MADYSFVKDPKGQILGLWLNTKIYRTGLSQNTAVIVTLLKKHGVGHDLIDMVIENKYRIVPNRCDQNGGCFLMFGTALAPGEETSHSIEEFVSKALISEQNMMMQMNEVGQLYRCLIAAIQQNCPGISPRSVPYMTIEKFKVVCPKCGPYSEEAITNIVSGGKGGVLEIFGDVVFGGPNVAALCQGACPACGGTTVNVIFGPIEDALSGEKRDLPKEISQSDSETAAYQKDMPDLSVSDNSESGKTPSNAVCVSAYHKNCHKGEFAGVTLSLRPGRSGQGYIFVNKAGQSIFSGYVKAVEIGAKQCLSQQGIPDMEVVLVKAIVHPVDSSIKAFAAAAKKAVMQALQQLKGNCTQ